MHICVSVNKRAEIDRIRRRCKVCKCWKRNPSLALGICCARYKPQPPATDMDRYSATSWGRTAALVISWFLLRFALWRVSTVLRVSISVCILSLFVSVFFDCLPQFAISVAVGVAVGVQLGWVDRQSHFAP